MTRDNHRCAAFAAICFAVLWAILGLYEMPLIEALLYLGKLGFLALSFIFTLVLAGALIETWTRRK